MLGGGTGAPQAMHPCLLLLHRVGIFVSLLSSRSRRALREALVQALAALDAQDGALPETLPLLDLSTGEGRSGLAFAAALVDPGSPEGVALREALRDAGGVQSMDPVASLGVDLENALHFLETSNPEAWRGGWGAAFAWRVRAEQVQRALFRWSLSLSPLLPVGGPLCIKEHAP